MTEYAELLVDGHRILPALLEDIGRARSTVHVSMFLFFRDPVGIEVADALVAARQRGVTVRVLLNVEKTAMGDPFSTGEREMMRHDPTFELDPLDVKPLCERLRAAGAEVIDTNIDYDLKRSSWTPRLASLAGQINGAIDVDELHIDHRKIIVIDGHVAYCGGANIGAQYMYHDAFDASKDAKTEGSERTFEPWWKWHDSLTRFEGAIVRDLHRAFHERWVLDGGDDFEPSEAAWDHPPRGQPIEKASLHKNEPNDVPNAIRELYVRLIGEAERSIFIENPYFYHPAVVEALLAARRANPRLRVDIVVPALTWNDNELAHDAQQHHYSDYLAAGIEVFEYQNHFNHLKIAVFDERWSVHGSTNLNFRSLEDDKDFEAVVLVDDVAFARRVLTDVRDVDIPRSKRFDSDEVDGTLKGILRIKTRDPRTLLLVSRKML